MKLERQEDSIGTVIDSKKLLTIALGAKTIGSTGRAPDDDRKHELQIGTVIDSIVDNINRSDITISLPSGEICD
jgi:hypothetical protein